MAEVLGYATPGVPALLTERDGDIVRFLIPTVGADGRVVWAVLSAVLFGAMGIALMIGAMGIALMIGAINRPDFCGWATAGFTLLIAWASAVRAWRVWAERNRTMTIEADPEGLRLIIPRGRDTESWTFAAADLRQVWVGSLADKVGGKPLWYLHVACADRHSRIAFAADGAEGMEGDLRVALRLPETGEQGPPAVDFELIESTVEVYVPERRG